MAIKFDSANNEITLPEVADISAAPGAGNGVIWVKDDAPNVLMFTDDAGTDHDLTAGGSGSPGGSDTQIQYNNSSAFAGDSGFTTNGSGSVNISGDLDVDNLNLNGNTLSSTNTDGPIIITPNGNGAVQVTSTGNTRGNNAIDFQETRSADAQVASGTNSFIGGGRNNTASGSFTAAFGTGCTASANAVVVGGYNNSVSAAYSAAFGISNNVNTGNSSFACGLGHNVSAAKGFATGQQHTVSGAYAHSSGQYNTASGVWSHAGGNCAVSNKRGQWSRGSGGFSGVKGNAQHSFLTLRNATTDNTVTELFLNGSSERLVIPSDTTWTFSILISARRTDANDESAAYKIEGCIDNNATVVALVGSIAVTVLAEDTAGWDVTAEADNTNDALVVKVTGENSKTIRWVASVHLCEVTG